MRAIPFSLISRVSGIPGRLLSGAFLALYLCVSTAAADTEFEHPGYLDDVSDERLQVSREVVIVPLSEPPAGSLVDKIFTEKMSKEFSREFRRRFGYTEFEQLKFTTSRVIESSDSGRQINVDDYVEKQEDFGQYIGKELTEYHVDNYLRGNRSTRGIYKAKEALSNVQIQTRSGYKVRFRYKISSNRVNFKVERPQEKFHNSFDIKPDGQEAAAHLSYDVTKSIRVGTDYEISNEVYAVYGEKRLSPTLSTSLTGQSFARDVGLTPKQDRVLLGLTWTD